ncbi:organic cation transporter protein-like [Dendronephthya gigantea]|uniref:organic cation transporter protein-like n=1 Tax=Dendronephthya gigantea TaxID=151771 RepID=UPI00106D9486|nr:organic cation transporter protein-like [Dendronephthya gigantea]
MKSSNIDDLLNILGKPGKLQSLSFLCLCANIWIVMMNHMASVFFNAKTDHWCKINGNGSFGEHLVTKSEDIHACYVSIGNNSDKAKCSEWTYDLPEGEKTVVSEFDLVCDDAYKSDLTTTIYFAGVMIGGVVFGMLADKYGRKRVLILTLLLSGIVGVAIFLLRYYAAYIVLRFFLGFFMQGIQNSSFILALEILSMKYRTPGGVIILLSGGVGMLFLDFLAYVLKDWSYVQLTTSLLPFLQLVAIWHIPESLRWNIVHKKFGKVEAIIKRYAAFNKLPFPGKLFEEIKSDDLNECVQHKPKGNVIDVFKSPKLRKISLILFLAWFTFSAGFYGLAFHISFLFGDKYLNFALSCIMDVIIGSNLIWIIPRYGRRRPMTILFFVSAVANAVCSIMSLESGSVKFVGTAFAIIGKASIGTSLAIGYIYTSEIYPTVVRNVGLGMNTFWTRLGGMAAPQIFFLGKHTSPFVPYTILSILCLMNGFFTLLLPETENQGLKDRMEVSKTSLMEKENGVISKPDSDIKRVECYETAI